MVLSWWLLQGLSWRGLWWSGRRILRAWVSERGSLGAPWDLFFSSQLYCWLIILWIITNWKGSWQCSWIINNEHEHVRIAQLGNSSCKFWSSQFSLLQYLKNSESGMLPTTPKPDNWWIKYILQWLELRKDLFLEIWNAIYWSYQVSELAHHTVLRVSTETHIMNKNNEADINTDMFRHQMSQSFE